MCPEGTTNLEDGAAACQIAVAPGTNLATRYAVIVSFGVLLNGTSLEDVAPKVQHKKMYSYVGQSLLGGCTSCWCLDNMHMYKNCMLAFPSCAGVTS